MRDGPTAGPDGDRAAGPRSGHDEMRAGARVRQPEETRPAPDSGATGARPLDAAAGARAFEGAAGARRRTSLPPSAGFRRLPNSGQIARRRLLLRWTKWLLPAGALLLLASIAAWPEIQRSLGSARIGLAQAGRVRLDSGRMLGARYRGLDGRDRPYMITAEEAQQVSAPAAPASEPAGTHAAADVGDRIDLTRPVADTLGQGGDWIRIGARDGIYMQHAQVLDVTHDVTLYRQDGIMMTSPMADFDLRRGVIASDAWVHAEGPFGVLDAQGYVLSQHDGLAQFRGPARLVLNDDRIARPAPATAPAPVRPAGRSGGA